MNSRNEKPPFEIYIGDLVNFLRYCKIWKADTFSAKKNVLVAVLVSLLLTSDTMLIISGFIDARNATNDLTSFAARVGPLCLQCIGFMKWSYCIWKVDEIGHLMATLERCHRLSMDINKSDLGWEKYKMEMSTARAHYVRFLYGWLCVCSYGILHWCTNPLILEFEEKGFEEELLFNDDDNCSKIENGNDGFTRKRHLPYLGWYPWNVNTNLGYASMFLIQFVGGMSSALGSIAFDVFYIASLIIVCAQLTYLNDSLVDDNDADMTLGAVTTCADFEIKLRNCVDHHSEILTFLNSLEILASPAMFVQCLENIIVLCMVSFEASTVEINTNLNTIMKLWSMLEYFLSVIVQLFIYCYYATKIRMLGLKLADSIYGCNWEKLPCAFINPTIIERKAFQRINYLVKIFMFRAQKEILLTGGPFYELTLETYKSVVGIAMSNSLILRQVTQDTD